MRVLRKIARSVTILPPHDWQTAGIGPGPEIAPNLRVTRDNWRLYPFSRWSFQHARELVPSVGLSASPAPLNLPDNVNGEDLLALALSDGGVLADLLATTYTDAMLVLHRGRIVLEHYTNGMTAAQPHMLFSITKSVVGLVALRLIKAQLIDPQSLVGKVLPELADSAFATTTLAHLLDMTDGVAFEEDYGNPQAAVHRYSAAYWTPAAGQEGMLGALARFEARDGAAGAQFRYRTPVADVVGLMLRRLTGQRLSDLVKQWVWHPAGCTDEAYMLVDTSGVEMGGTGLNATARDVARIGLWLCGEQQRSLLATLMTGGDRTLFAASPQSATRPGGSYRALWWIDHGTPPTLSANGVFGQRLWIDPENAIVIVKLGSHPLASNSLTDPEHRIAFDAIRAALVDTA
jgi:CubicO group peptidase (beta-lactamase class C family)